MFMYTNRTYVEKMKLIGTVVAVELKTGSGGGGGCLARGGSNVSSVLAGLICTC